MSPQRYFKLEKEMNRDRDAGSNLLINKRPFEAPLGESINFNKNSYKLPELRMYPKNKRLDQHTSMATPSLHMKVESQFIPKD